jgi:hypothetical protein
MQSCDFGAEALGPETATRPDVGRLSGPRWSERFEGSAGFNESERLKALSRLATEGLTASP